jgi:hypothetical protein
VSNQTIFGRTYRAKAAFRPEGHLDIAGEYRGRYDHQNRFVLQHFVDNFNLPANSSWLISYMAISVPSGKALYLRRVRWRFFSSGLRPRVSTSSYAWTGSSHLGDIGMNEQMAPGGGLISVGLFIVNTSYSNQSDSGVGIWAELEIR